MTQHIIHLSTNFSGTCDHCSESINGEDIGKNINHYLSKHNYKVVHVGQETIDGSNGEPWQTTVAILSSQ